MKKQEIEEAKLEYEREQNKSNSLSIGQTVYISDVYGDLFECKIISVDVENNEAEIDDYSYVNVEKKPRRSKINVMTLYTKEKAKEYWKSDYYKYKIF